MDAKDHSKITHHPGPESHGIHLCHKCGWPFPNPHPSAKHRRAHKRVCGSVEGYKLDRSEGSNHSAVSDDDEHPSDDDHETPSPKIVERSKNGIATSGIEERSNRLEDEVFSDAVAEFSESGISPGTEKVLEDARESITSVEKVVMDDLDTKQHPSPPPEDNSSTDTIQPPGSLTDCSIVQSPGVPKTTNDHVPSSYLGSVAGSISEDVNRESTLGLSGDRGDLACNLPCNLPGIIPGIPTQALQEDYKTNAGDGFTLCSSSWNIRDSSTALIEQNTDAIEEDENKLDNKLLKIAVSPNENASETSEAELKLEKTDEKGLDPVEGDIVVQSEEHQTDVRRPKISPTSLSLDLEPVEHIEPDTAERAYSASGGGFVEFFKAKGEEGKSILVTDGKLQDTAVSTSEDVRETSEVGLKLEKIDLKALDLVAVGGIVVVKEDQSGGVVLESSPRDLFPDLKSIGQTETSADTACIQANAAQGSYLASSGDLVDSFKAKGEENESAFLASVSIPAVDNPEITIESFSDHDVVKSNLPVTMDSSEMIKEMGDNTNEPVFQENYSVIQSTQLAGCKGACSSDVQAFEDNLNQDDIFRNPTVPVEGIAVSENHELNELGTPVEHSRSEMKNQTVYSLEELGTHDSSKEPLELQMENETEILSDPVTSTIDIEICQKTNLVDNSSGGDHDRTRIENYDMAGTDMTEKATDEDLTDSRKTASECVTTISNSHNQAISLLGGDSTDLDKIKIETYEIAGMESLGGSKDNNIAPGENVEIRKCETAEKENREGKENIVIGTPESRVAGEDDVNMPERNLPETEYKDSDEISVPSGVGIDITETHPSLQNQDKVSQQCEISKHDEVKVQLLGVVSGAAESNLDGEKSSQNSENLSMEEPKLKTGDFESSVQCLTSVEGNHTKMLDGEASGFIPRILLSGNADSSVQSSTAVNDDCTKFLAGDASVISSSTKEPKPSSVNAESFVQMSITAVEDAETKKLDGNASGDKSGTLQGKGDNHSTDRQLGNLPLDVSIDSVSQTDSLEGNWGSVSGLSSQSEALAVVDTEALPPIDSKPSLNSEKDALNKTKCDSELHASDKSDVFEPPSFATLVQPGVGGNSLKSTTCEIQTSPNQQQPKSASAQAGWFPSLTNVVNESEGRKKNEEIIAKVNNWSTGKQHTPLKNLLVEANSEMKPKSPSPKENSASVTQKEQAAAKNGSVTPQPRNMNSIPGAKAVGTEPPGKELGKEWNSPARYPMENKREKKKVKGKPYWAPFVCCSSIN